MANPTRDREELISSFASKLFSAMLEEVVMDATLQSHKDVIRANAVCQVCGTRCGSVHAQGAHSNGAGPSTAGPSTSLQPPPPRSPAPAGKTVTGTSTPSAKDKSDGNIYFECTNCQKKIASNRYAPHLSGCLGLGTGSRRGAARNAAAKNKLGAELDRPWSPFVGSDFGSPSQDTVNGKAKGKAKNGKKINGKFVDPELNGNHKRPGTPDGPPSKKSKKQKTSVAGSDTTLIAQDESNYKKPHIPAAAKMPAKLGVAPASPTAPGSPSAGSGSQNSSRGSPSASVSGGSLHAQSPGGSKPPKTYKSLAAANKRRGRPPGSGKNQIVAAEATAVIHKTEEKEEDADFIDVDGEDHEEVSSDSS